MEFTLAFPSEAQAGAARLFGSRSGRDMDKLKAAANIRTERAKEIDSLLLTDAVANFECKVIREIETGDHVIFVGRVLHAYETSSPLNRLYTLVKSLHMGGMTQHPEPAPQEQHG
jgi:flavin reductase (DIM6/NTAB) family NADH-FMN oxidoreductase RutF